MYLRKESLISPQSALTATDGIIGTHRKVKSMRASVCFEANLVSAAWTDSQETPRYFPYFCKNGLLHLTKRISFWLQFHWHLFFLRIFKTSRTRRTNSGRTSLSFLKERTIDNNGCCVGESIKFRSILYRLF